MASTSSTPGFSTLMTTSFRLSLSTAAQSRPLSEFSAGHRLASVPLHCLQSARSCKLDSGSERVSAAKRIRQVTLLRPTRESNLRAKSTLCMIHYQAETDILKIALWPVQGEQSLGNSWDLHMANRPR